MTPLANLDFGNAPTPMCFSSFIPTQKVGNFSDSLQPESPLIRLYPASFQLQETTEEDQEDLPMDFPIPLLAPIDTKPSDGLNQGRYETRSGSSTQVSVSPTLP